MGKITTEDGQWVRLRERTRKFKSGERRALYEKVDGLAEMGQVSSGFHLMRAIAAFLIEDWSLEIPCPRAGFANGTHGQVSWLNMDSFDELDVDLEDEIFAEAKWWMDRLAVNFNPSNDQDSPTKPSGG